MKNRRVLILKAGHALSGQTVALALMHQVNQHYPLSTIHFPAYFAIFNDVFASRASGCVHHQ
jgi:hypothetical protein